MAILDEDRKLNAVRFISKIDSAVDPDLSDRKLYEEDIIKNADKLVMKKGQEPTIFLLNFDLTAKEDALIKDAQIKGIDDDKNAIMALGKWAYTVARVCLKDIQNPPGVKGIEFKKEGRGFPDDRTLDKISKYGIVEEIWHQYLSLTSHKAEVKKEAKN
jgi:hypothetical protein